MYLILKLWLIKTPDVQIQSSSKSACPGSLAQLSVSIIKSSVVDPFHFDTDPDPDPDPDPTPDPDPGLTYEF